MCTAIAFRSRQGDSLFGRTMDFSHPISPSVYVTPRGYVWTNRLRTIRLRSRYGILGIGQDLEGVLFADGVNERGLSAAALYFPGYAAYDSPDTAGGALVIAAVELNGFLLGMCASVEQAAALVRTIRIVGTEDPVTHSVAPLHWILTDRIGQCLVIEKTAGGLHLHENPIGVLTNSPDFPWHMTHLRSFVQLRPEQEEQARWGNMELEPFGQGGGTWGLPGDFTPPSRFIRAAYLKGHIPAPETRQEAMMVGFHILENLSIPRGAVVTSRGTDDYTQYTAVLNTADGSYAVRTYEDGRIRTARLTEQALSGSKAACLFALER